MHLKYLTQDQLDTFINGMGSITTEELLNDKGISALSKRMYKEDDIACFAPNLCLMKLVEGFLYLFEDREEYRMCNEFIKSYPELVYTDEEELSHK